MKGLDFSRIVNQNENRNIYHIKCQICLLLPIDPEMCHTCGETFCSFCINNLSTKNCPTCKNTYTRALPQKSLVGILEDLIVYCRYKEQGCNLTVSYMNMLSHEKECQFREIKCVTCDDILIMNNLQDHLLTCKGLLYVCDECGFSCKRQENKNHSCFRYFEYVFTEKMKLLMAQQFATIKAENEEKYKELKSYFDYLKNEINRIDDDLKAFKFLVYPKIKKFEDNEIIVSKNKIDNEVKILNKSLNNINLDELNKSGNEATLKNFNVVASEDVDNYISNINNFKFNSNVSTKKSEIETPREILDQKNTPKYKLEEERERNSNINIQNNITNTSSHNRDYMNNYRGQYLELNNYPYQYQYFKNSQGLDYGEAQSRGSFNQLDYRTYVNTEPNQQFKNSRPISPIRTNQESYGIINNNVTNHKK